LRGPVEIVRFHQKKVDLEDYYSPPFNPTPGEYIPENFTRLRLMQLKVIPKSALGGLRPLSKLKETREHELAAAGLGYKIMRVDYPWPKGTFWVSISTPYRLFERYTQSDEHIFILTVGENKEDPLLTNPAERISGSLSTYLEQFQRKLMDDALVYENPVILYIWLLVCALAGAFALMPPRRRWLRRLSLVGKSSLIFVNTLAFIGWLFILIGWRYRLDRWANDGTALMFTSLVMPWVSRGISLHLGGRRPWRVFSWVAGLCVLTGLFSWAAIPDYLDGRLLLIGSTNFAFAMLLQAILGGLCGLILGLAHVPEDDE